MSSASDTRELRSTATGLKNDKFFFEALLLRFEIERRYSRTGTSLDEHCFNLNWITYLGLRTRCLFEAERAARQCLQSYRVNGKSLEHLATYHSMLARVLAECRRFDEAVEHGEKALALFIQNHGEKSRFVDGRRLLLDRMRRRDTDTYVEERF